MMTCVWDSVTLRLFARLSETRIMFIRHSFVANDGYRTPRPTARHNPELAPLARPAGTGQAPAEALSVRGTRGARFHEPGVRR